MAHRILCEAGKTQKGPFSDLWRCVNLPSMMASCVVKSLKNYSILSIFLKKNYIFSRGIHLEGRAAKAKWKKVVR